MAVVYDLIVIGGGSGGLACAKASAALGARVALLDFVKPSPQGTTWGLGGTCVNVGCIPKKIMHQAATLEDSMEDAAGFGWELSAKPKHTWSTLVQGIKDYIGSLNWSYRVQLREKKVDYFNAFASFVDAHTVRAVDKKNKEVVLKGSKFLIATGGRPKYPDIPGAREFCISSDDIFSLARPPGKTLVVGASYVALECAGFLKGLGYDTTVMVRSILLRGFDQEMAKKIGSDLEARKVNFLYNTQPKSVTREASGKLVVNFAHDDGSKGTDTFDTVLFAVGRDPCLADLNLAAAGVANIHKSSGKLITNEADQTDVEHIFAVGDVIHGRPELTPVAIKAGQLLAARLFGDSKQLCAYEKIPTTVFTPLEYGSCGLAEEDAIAKHGAENIETFLSELSPLQYALPHRQAPCFAKLVCLKTEDMRVLGLHITGPSAGEITQGFAIGIFLNARKADFDNMFAIHPTVAESFTSLTTTRSSGEGGAAGGC